MSRRLPQVGGVYVQMVDEMQARWGSHGDYEVIALAPESPQEAFELTFDAFDLADNYRTPVMDDWFSDWYERYGSTVRKSCAQRR